MGGFEAKSPLGEIEEPYVGMEPENDENAYAYYCKYARKVGFYVRKKLIRRCRKSGMVIHRIFCCSREGKRGFIPGNLVIDCNAELICKLIDGHFKVVSFVKEHNHDCREILPANWDHAKFSATTSNIVNRILNKLTAENVIPKSYTISPCRMNDKLTSERDQSFEVLSLEPKAFLYHNFLSKEECEHLVALGKPRMARSLVSINGQRVLSSALTSSGTFLRRGQDEIVKRIERRIAETTLIPVERGEALYVFHYEVCQKHEFHHDGFHRLATCVMYLSDVEEGGETIFPSAKGNISTVAWRDNTSHSFKSGLVVKPKMGSALVFWNLKPDNTIDQSSRHGACPVIKGNKWSCTRWIDL